MVRLVHRNKFGKPWKSGKNYHVYLYEGKYRIKFTASPSDWEKQR